MTYNINLETGRLELNNLSKEEYNKLGNELKKKIRAYFLFSKTQGCWVSKSTKNHSESRRIAATLGFTEEVIIGNELSKDEKKSKDYQRIKNLIEKYKTRIINAKRMKEALQAEYNKYKGDIAFITQPNINSSRGRAFTNKRNRIMDRYIKGFAEIDKINYYEARIKALSIKLETL